MPKLQLEEDRGQSTHPEAQPHDVVMLEADSITKRLKTTVDLH